MSQYDLEQTGHEYLKTQVQMKSITQKKQKQNWVYLNEKHITVALLYHLLTGNGVPSPLRIASE